jgi:hypothetical protein
MNALIYEVNVFVIMLKVYRVNRYLLKKQNNVDSNYNLLKVNAT